MHWGLTALLDLAAYGCLAAAFAGFCLAFSIWYSFYKPNVLRYFGLRPEESGVSRHPLVVTWLMLLAGLWVLRGVATVPYDLADLLAGVGEPLPALAGTLACLAAGVCAAGLWRLRPWASLAFAVWALAALVRFFALSPLEAGGDTWVLAAFGGLMALVVLLISAYLRVALARPEQEAA